MNDMIINADIPGTSEAVNTAHIEPRKWYTVMLGYGGCDSHPFAAVEKIGRKDGGYYSLLTHGMSKRPMCDVWRMIDLNGYEMDASDNDLQANGSVGIGSLVPCQYDDLPDLTDEKLAELIETGKRNREEDQRKAEERKRKLEEDKRRLAREFSYLPYRANDSYLTAAKVAANLREELKHRFPGVKFSVRSKSFSGGNDITVHYVNGPAKDEIEPIVRKYQDHHADAESGDYWDYDPTAFNRVFGGVSFTWCERTEDANAPDNMPTKPGDKRSRAAVATVEDKEITVSITENVERNGIEIRFCSIPSDEVRGSLKSNGWRWSKFSKCWYTRASDRAREFAHEIAAKFAA